MLTADRIQNVDEVQNVDCRLKIGYKMQTEDLKSFFVWYYLHYFEIFLAHFLMKIDRTIISNLHSLLTLRESWLVWCLYRFYQRNKSRCRCKRDVTIEYLTRATFEKQLTALHVVRIVIFLSGMCLFCWQKCEPGPKLFLRLDLFSTLVDHIILTYLSKSFIPDKKIK